MPLSLSAADQTRLKRLRKANAQQTEISAKDDVTNVVLKADPFSPPRLISRDVGSSKIRRPGSFWTDYAASQRTDQVLKSETAGCTPQLKRSTICSTVSNECVSGAVLSPKITGCLNCRLNGKQHLRM